MIRSMTGFGLGEADQGGVHVRVEARSVNHRYLQIKTRLPSEFGELEPDLEVLAKKKLSRGVVSLVVHVARDAAASAYSIDEEVALRYRKALSRFAKQHGMSEELSLGELVQLPGVVAPSADPARHERETKLVLRASKAAIERLIEARGEEGMRTAADLTKHFGALERVVARITKRMPLVVKRHHEALTKRVDELAGSKVQVGEADLARELAVLADKMDVTEELERLASHLVQGRGLLEKGGEVGRRLDFLVQELFRESNTIGSKCNDAEVAHEVIEAKSIIERIREQVQNLE